MHRRPRPAYQPSGSFTSERVSWSRRTPRKHENETQRTVQSLGPRRLALRLGEGLWAGRGWFSGPRLRFPLPPPAAEAKYPGSGGEVPDSGGTIRGVWEMKYPFQGRVTRCPARAVRALRADFEVGPMCFCTPRKHENAARGTAQSRDRDYGEGLWAGRGCFSGPCLWFPLPFRPRSMGEG